MHNIIPGNLESPQSNCTLGKITLVPDPLQHLKKRQKPQISSIPGVSPKEPRRYQVVIDDEIVATELTCDEASAFIKAGVAR